MMDIATELAKPLDRKHVATRQQSGRSLSYIEAHHAIREANAIFGFHGWTRETVECRCVVERERKIGREPNTKDGWAVSYVAKVRVVALGAVREGTGSGHGIDVDPGLAHESAIKEAESDAMKRALMTFGDRFGLALYDKAQEHVADVPPAKPQVTPAQWCEQSAAKFTGADSVASLDAWWAKTASARSKAEAADALAYRRMEAAFNAARDKLEGAPPHQGYMEAV